MRIIAGQWRGRRLGAPDGRDVRPTTDRVREAIFGSLAGRIEGAAVLDVFGGSGALGLEAASRGAEQVVIIERSRRAQAAIKANIAALGGDGRVRLICAPYERAMRTLSGHMKFNVFFLDPPYDSSQYDPALEMIRETGLADEGAIAMLESNRELVPHVEGFEITKRKRYGSVYVAYGEFG